MAIKNGFEIIKFLWPRLTHRQTYDQNLKDFQVNPGWKTVDFWTMRSIILMVGRIWASLILINLVMWSLVWFLQNSYFLGNFQPRDSYKKNSYKKETVYAILTLTEPHVDLVLPCNYSYSLRSKHLRVQSSNRSTGTRCDICSNLTINTRCHTFF